ncbi:MAG: heat-inducible transcriptional repressor HrcA [bacterium]|nr:heat-inducible transcriptional repressor HrcA [bacterium]
MYPSQKPRIHGAPEPVELTERQARVLRALVAAYVGQAGPVASTTLSHLMPTPLSPASIRNTLSELHERGLIAKAHASAGRVPTAMGLRVFVDELLEIGFLGPHHQRLLDRAFDSVDPGAAPRQASHLLSEHTRQLGFVLAPRVERLRLKTIHLIPVATGRILAVLVAENGNVVERVIEDEGPISARELEQVRDHLAERIEGRTLLGLRRLLEAEREGLRGEADAFLRRAWHVGLAACDGPEADGADDLVITSRRALLDQPEFAEPERIRGLFATLETNERLLALLEQIAEADAGERRVGLAMSLGTELGEPSLRDCTLVAVPYGGGAGAGAADAEAEGVAPLGMLGVIGPQRMDYSRVIPLVGYFSDAVTRKLLA